LTPFFKKSYLSLCTDYTYKFLVNELKYYFFLLLADGDDEADVDDNDKRVKRQREALVHLRDQPSLKEGPPEGCISEQKQLPNKRHHHLSVKSAAKVKCAKTHVQSSSQQRHKQLQFLRNVHSVQTRLAATKTGTPNGQLYSDQINTGYIA
jgi:hypothetical protein